MFAIFILIVALIISGVAAYYSIAGLCAIFAAAVTPVIIMGAALEVGKITATVWLHKYWNQASLQFKLYLIPAIAVLMVITSMGIFGYLSKAHMDQSVPAGDVIAQVQIFDDKIKTERDNIETARRALQQMDAQVDQMLSRTDNEQGANRAVKIRKQQSAERQNIQESIVQSQKNIVQLQSERAPIAAEVRKVEAEVGPIRYIAALIYGDNLDSNLLEHAVRWVIILLIFVFDPLAVVLILAADQTLIWNKQDKVQITDSSNKNPNEIKDNAVNTSNIDKFIVEELVEETTKEINEELNTTNKYPYEELMATPDLDIMNDYVHNDLVNKIRNGSVKFQELSRIEQQSVLDQLTYQEKERFLK